MSDDPVKLILNYDVTSDNIQEYRQFALGQYIPMMHSMGLQISEAWHTAYGEVPNRRVVFVCETSDTMQELLDSDRWFMLNEELQQYVNDFSYKVVPYRSGIQI